MREMRVLYLLLRRKCIHAFPALSFVQMLLMTEIGGSMAARAAVAVELTVAIPPHEAVQNEDAFIPHLVHYTGCAVRV